MHLARLELRVGLDAILDRLPNLRLDPDAPAPVIEGFAFRGPDRLPVLFDPLRALRLGTRPLGGRLTAGEPSRTRGDAECAPERCSADPCA